MFKRIVLRWVSFALCAILACVPASAMNRVTHYYGINPSSAQFNLQARYERLGIGTFWLNTFPSTQPMYWDNLAVTASGGLYVQVAPALANTLGAVYGPEVDDASIFGNGSVALAADPTIIYVQGLLSSPAIALGPLSPPTTSGQGYDYIVECQPQTVDEDPQTFNVVNTSNQVTTATYDRERDDIVACQTKRGAAATSPVAPTSDSGWVTVATINSTYGTTTLSSGNISMSTATQFNAVVSTVAAGTGVSVTQSAGVATVGLSHGDYINQGVSSITLGSGSSASTLSYNGIAVNGTIQSLNGILESPSGVNLDLGANGTSAGAPYVSAADESFNATTVNTTNITNTTFTGSTIQATHINAPGSAALYLDYNSGTNAVIIGSGSSTVTGTAFYHDGTASIGSTLTTNGISDSGGINSTYAYGAHFDGLVVGYGGNQINASGSNGLFLNYGSGTSGVIIGNGANAISGTQFSADGDTNIGRNLSVNSGTVTVGSSTLSSSGLVVGGNIFNTNGVFQTSASIMELCPGSLSSSCPVQINSSGSISVGGSTFGSTGLVVSGNIESTNGVFESPASTNLILGAALTSSGAPYVSYVDNTLHASDANTNTDGIVEPTYNSTGGIPSTSQHHVFDSFTCNANSSGVCSGTISLTNSAAFTSTAIVCEGNLVGQSGILGNYTLNFSPSSGSSIAYEAMGLAASVGYAGYYSCWGH